MYADLGFQELARRTNWIAKPDSYLSQPATDIQIVPRHPRFWAQQQDWLRHLNPDALGWYHSFNTNLLRPGFLNCLYLTLFDMNIKQWAAVRDDKLLATLAWTMASGRSDSLIAATPPQSDVETSTEALTQLLIHARRALARRASLSLDYPGGEMRDAFTAAGFTERRTWLWMRAERAT